MKIKKIQKIKTKDGFMVPAYRDWDVATNEGHVPKMVYVTYLEPGVEKDIILHKNRKTYITCIHGKVSASSFQDGKEISHELNFENAIDEISLLIANPGEPLLFKNKSSGVSMLLNCPSPAWHPDNQDTYKYETWEDYVENV